MDIRTQRRRPAGVTILGIIWPILGVVATIAGLALDLDVLSDLRTLFNEWEYYDGYFGFVASTGSLIALWGISFVVAGFGLLRGKRWGWLLMVFLQLLDMVESALFLISNANLLEEIIFLIISGLILVYLFRPNVRVYFEKAVA